MRSLFDFDNRRRHDIDARIEMLRDEIAALSRDASRLGKNAYESARASGQDVFSELPRYARSALPVARRQTQVAGRTVRDHPTAAAAVAGLVLVGLAATLIYSRR